MNMTQTELEGCFRLLRAYWPGEWDDARYMVWAEAFQNIDYPETRQALIAMGHNENFCSVAKFFTYLRPHNKPDPRGRFSPGAGWLPEITPTAHTDPDTATFDARWSELRRALETGSEDTETTP